MTSDHCRASLIQQKLTECSKCLKIILEVLNENNSSNIEDDDEIYFKRKDWITVKDKIKQYEVNIETIVRTAILLKRVRKRRGRLVKNHIKEIIRDLERKIGSTIEIIKETKVTSEEQKYEDKGNEKQNVHEKNVIKSAFRPQTKQQPDDEQGGKPKGAMKNNIGRQSSERASTSTGSIRKSASTKGRSDSTGDQNTGSKKRVRSKERSASTGGQSAGSIGKSASAKGRSDSTGDQTAGSKKKSTSSKERSASIGGRSAGSIGKSASTKGRSVSTGGQSAGSIGKSASTKGRSASTGDQSAGSKKKSASIKGISASSGDQSAGSKKKSASIKGISASSGGQSAGSKEKSNIGMVPSKRQLKTKQNDKDKPKDGILKRENERSKHKTEGKNISSTTARRVTMSEATDKKGSTNERATKADARRNSLESGEKQEIRGRSSSVGGRIVSKTQRQQQPTVEAQTTKDGGEIHRGKTNGRGIGASKLTNARQNNRVGGSISSNRTQDQSVKKEDSNRESHKKGVQEVRSEQQRQQLSQPATEAQIAKQTIKTQSTMKGSAETQHNKTNGPEVNVSGTKTSKQPGTALQNSKAGGAVKNDTKQDQSENKEHTNKENLVQAGKNSDMGNLKQKDHSEKASKVKADIKSINEETDKSAEAQPKEMNAKITSELANRSEVKNVPRDLPDTKSESHIGGDQAKDVSDAMKASQSHAGHTALSIISEPQKKPSKEPNQQTSQPTIRSSYLMKHVPTKKEKKNAKSGGCFTIKK